MKTKNLVTDWNQNAWLSLWNEYQNKTLIIFNETNQNPKHFIECYTGQQKKYPKSQLWQIIIISVCLCAYETPPKTKPNQTTPQPPPPTTSTTTTIWNQHLQQQQQQLPANPTKWKSYEWMALICVNPNSKPKTQNT